MNEDFELILSLKRVLESAGEGSGMGRTLVPVLKEADGAGRETARLLLLGNPIPSALRPMIEGGGEEVAMLASLIVAAPKSSAYVVGKAGGTVAHTLERWIRARENRRLEQKVLRFRGLVTSGILGAVTAMIAALGPLVGALGTFGGAPSDPSALAYCGAAMAAISSGMLGTFITGRGFYQYVLAALAAFGVVWAAASPLGSVSTAGLWGVK